MPEQRLLITPWGSGDGPIPGSPTTAERVLTDTIVKVWPFQNVIMGMIKRKVTDFQLRHEWPVRTLNASNTTATPWAMDIGELAPITSEPFMLDNTWTCLRFAVIVTHIAQLAKKNWVADQMLEWVEEGIFQMLRGWENLVYTSEYVAATAPNVIPSMAGIGLNAAGTGLRAAAGPKWNGDITDTNSRMSQRAGGGAAWDFALFEAGLRILRRAGAVPTDCLVGNTNKARVEGFPHTAQHFTEPAKDMKAHRNIDMVRTTYGTIRVHLCVLDDYPQRAVITMDPDAIEFVVPSGLGLQMLPIEPQGDKNQVMCKSMGSLRILFPHGIDLLTNTAA